MAASRALAAIGTASAIPRLERSVARDLRALLQSKCNHNYVTDNETSNCSTIGPRPLGTTECQGQYPRNIHGSI